MLTRQALIQVAEVYFGQLNFDYACFDADRSTQAHSVVAGTPAYRRELVRQDAPAGLADFDAWVTRTVLNPQIRFSGKPAISSPRRPRSAIRDPSLYHSVLAAVAEGNATSGGIASYIGRKPTR